MTCRHAPGDPNCTTQRHPSYEQPATPDAENYEVEDIAETNGHLVLKVKYPNCKNCSYEGSKVMVFLNTTSLLAMKWRRIDPHFRDPAKPLAMKEAPTPAARFPGSREGWTDAIAYANGKGRPVPR